MDSFCFVCFQKEELQPLHLHSPVAAQTSSGSRANTIPKLPASAAGAAGPDPARRTLCPPLGVHLMSPGSTDGPWGSEDRDITPRAAGRGLACAHRCPTAPGSCPLPDLESSRWESHPGCHHMGWQHTRGGTTEVGGAEPPVHSPGTSSHQSPLPWNSPWMGAVPRDGGGPQRPPGWRGGGCSAPSRDTAEPPGTSGSLCRSCGSRRAPLPRQSARFPPSPPSQHPRSKPGRFWVVSPVRDRLRVAVEPRSWGAQPLGSCSGQATPKGQPTFSLNSEGIWIAEKIWGFPGHFPPPTLSKHIPWHKLDIPFLSRNPRDTRCPSGSWGIFARFGIV
ncbi:serine/threonine-protein kinase SBK1 isoform X3 [Pseudopipra pipra]|uniref:serine/threonine-protein kinase SBK1 isoform X3 n=1 Tax=Pseudopipra pipra TaxID=415032 RepID=UPI003139AC4C